MNLIYVDDEQRALDNFRLTVENMHGVDSLQLFKTGQEALEWAKTHQVDAAFLDMQMDAMHGLEVARALHKLDEDICVVFVTAYSQFALEAFAADAVGYIMKPYTREEVRKELKKAARYTPAAEQNVVIKTIPTFSIRVDGKELRMPNTKCKEMLALLLEKTDSICFER